MQSDIPDIPPGESNTGDEPDFEVPISEPNAMDWQPPSGPTRSADHRPPDASMLAAQPLDGIECVPIIMPEDMDMPDDVADQEQTHAISLQGNAALRKGTEERAPGNTSQDLEVAAKDLSKSANAGSKDSHVQADENLNSVPGRHDIAINNKNTSKACVSNGIQSNHEGLASLPMTIGQGMFLKTAASSPVTSPGNQNPAISNLPPAAAPPHGRLRTEEKYPDEAPETSHPSKGARAHQAAEQRITNDQPRVPRFQRRRRIGLDEMPTWLASGVSSQLCPSEQGLNNAHQANTEVQCHRVSEHATAKR